MNNQTKTNRYNFFKWDNLFDKTNKYKIYESYSQYNRFKKKIDTIDLSFGKNHDGVKSLILKEHPLDNNF